MGWLFGACSLWRDVLFSLGAGGRSLTLPQLDVPKFVDFHRRPYLWRWRRGGCRGERGAAVERAEGEKKGRGICDWYVKKYKKLLKIKKEYLCGTFWDSTIEISLKEVNGGWRDTPEVRSP